MDDKRLRHSKSARGADLYPPSYIFCGEYSLSLVIIVSKINPSEETNYGKLSQSGHIHSVQLEIGGLARS